MVKLTKIYTRGGDGGQTSLTGGDRVAKYDLRVAAYGTVDETNAAVGLARLHCGTDKAADTMLTRIQNDLFDLGADLSTPLADNDDSGDDKGDSEDRALRIVAAQTERLEAEIDDINKDLADLTSFVLPGGSPAAAHLHLCRTTARRAERLICELAADEAVNAEAIRYINRLSDHFFVLARRLNDNGAGDILWQPGGNR